MKLSRDIILQILDTLFNIFEYKCIVTGSCSDMFNINFEDIKDIDIVIDEDSFNKFKSKIDNNRLFTLLTVLNGINGKNGTKLYRYLYIYYQIDITIILSGSEFDNLRKYELENTKQININEKTYIIHSLETRLKHLINTTNEYVRSRPDYETKIKKAHDRLEIYENLFRLQMRDKTDSRNDT
jgi:hypothetical protein